MDPDTMAGGYGLKRYFNGEAAHLIGGRIRAVYPGFDIEGYAAETERRVPGKELKERVLVLAEGLRTRLPGDYPGAVSVLLAPLGDELAEGEGVFNTSWFLMPVARFVEEYGPEHPELSLGAIEEITRRHTGEYAIRPYIERHRGQVMERIVRWARSPSHNVRRLASGGVRPRLPWARTLDVFVKDPRPVPEVLEPLRRDPSGHVRRSVANNLDDISRDNPGAALATAPRRAGWRRAPSPRPSGSSGTGCAPW
ncbi:hypothetical protein [Streptomyces verrucosisporus]|uniref:hypothetical protein n=1 Tax=Streptomyces verrucosisporus TaxID=1695161 RepID=UPI001F123D10|nr:hypothetical protein [Streptomyces verrucosisporus]